LFVYVKAIVDTTPSTVHAIDFHRMTPLQDSHYKAPGGLRMKHSSDEVENMESTLLLPIVPPRERISLSSELTRTDPSSRVCPSGSGATLWDRGIQCRRTKLDSCDDVGEPRAILETSSISSPMRPDTSLGSYCSTSPSPCRVSLSIDGTVWPCGLICCGFGKSLISEGCF